MNMTHVKRRNTDPAAALESIEGQVARNKPPQGASLNGPVREEQIMPRLRHHPRAGRKRPWTMRSVLEFRVQGQSAIFNCQLLIRKTFAYLTALTFLPL